MTRYETQTDISREETARLWLQDHWQREIRPRPELSTWDWDIYHDGTLTAIAEFKYRNRVPGQFQTFGFPEHKLAEMLEYAQEQNVKPLFIMSFTGDVYYKILGEHDYRNIVDIPRKDRGGITVRCVDLYFSEMRHIGKMEIAYANS